MVWKPLGGKDYQLMFIKKRRLDIGEEKDIENAIAQAEALRAFIDYNVMMGNIEDPTDESEEE